MSKTIDLHVHSTGSDGTCSPAELILEAKKAGLSAIALTDHDSVSGIEEAMEAGKLHNIEVIPGVELSTDYEGTEIHVVGLFIDKENETLKNQLAVFRDNRDNRNLKMIDRLREEGYNITAEEIYKRNPDSVIARPHIAAYLVETGQVKDTKTVFKNLIGDGCKCYVDRYKITPMQAVSIIHEAGGVAILAHPCFYEIPRATLLQMIDEMMEVGLDGLEAIYSCNQGSDEKDYKELAKKYGILISGGSDFHGANKPYIHLGTGKGNMTVPYEVLEDLKSYYQSKSR